MIFNSRYILLLFLTIFSVKIAAQDSIQKKKLSDFVDFNGYVKELFVSDFSSSTNTYNFIHNRLNFKFYPSKNIIGALEIRNRIYLGKEIQNTLETQNIIEADNSYYKLSKLLINKNDVVIHSMIDRFWLNWSYQKWSVRVGRQRINWGKTMVWNPNDLFNTFNYANFDYEEQPGSDALKISYYPTGMSAVEFALKPSKRQDETVAAAIIRFNKWNYDFQFLGGLYYTDIALGTGWAGNIKNAGFKGEITWFQPRKTPAESNGVLSAVTSIDYSFKNSTYIQGAILYNNHSNSFNSTNFFEQTANNNVSAKNLMPSDWSYFTQISRQINPLLTIGISFIYGAKPQFLFSMPTFSYSLSTNLEISIIEQSVFMLDDETNKNPFNNFFLRLKWNF